MLQKNQTIEVEIVSLSHQGEGIARYEGMVVFIPMTAIGDKLIAKVVKVLQNRAYAILLEITEPSPHRVPEGCPVFRLCGGCGLRHLSYTHELAVKEGWVAENLRRIGGVEIPLEPIIPSPSSERYRNKAQYPVRLVEGKIRVGFFSRHSHRIAPMEDCLLQPAFFGDIAAALIRYMERFGVTPYDEVSHTGTVRHLYIRHAKKTGQVMVCVVTNSITLPEQHLLVGKLCAAHKEVASVLINQNKKCTNVILGEKTVSLLGGGYIEDELAGIRLRISAASFYQVNRDAAELLYRKALEYADPGPEDIVLDLYCGAGAIGLSMAHQAGQVIGVEQEPRAVEDAVTNAEINGIRNARFIEGDAAQAAVRLAGEGIRPRIVILDPPRKGVEQSLIQTVAGMGPDKVVYISCDSATLARDMKIFAEHGYKAARIGAVDLFPRTAHVEGVALLTAGYGN